MNAIRHMHQPIILLILTALAVMFLIFGFTKRSGMFYVEPHVKDSDELFCHSITTGKCLLDISDNPPSIQKKNIFFLETSCNSYNKGKIFIKARQACAVESAARMNPNMNVYLLYASPGITKDENTESDRILQMLSSYPNVKIMHFNIERYLKGSPVEILWTSGQIKTSIYPMAHTSDILRLLTLWKFGGIYLDLDVLVMKSLEHFPENFAGAESGTLLANGVMGFSKFGKGRKYVNECLDDVSHNFNGQIWNYNGPQLISRTIFSHCPEFDAQTLIRFEQCEEFRIFPPSAFYMISYTNWAWFFNNSSTEVLEPYLEAQSYMIHAWNKLSFETNISKTAENVLYLRLASKYCPGVVQELDEYF